MGDICGMDQEECIVCGSTDSICHCKYCNRPLCGLHRVGTGSLRDGYSCEPSAFGNNCSRRTIPPPPMPSTPIQVAKESVKGAVRSFFEMDRTLVVFLIVSISITLVALILYHLKNSTPVQ